MEDRWTSGPRSGHRIQSIGLLDYVSDGPVAVITLNRPEADNAITTESEPD